MKNSEEVIDRTLARLREAEVPEGMELRILAALREREPERRVWASVAWGAVAAGLMVVGVVAVMHWNSHVSPQTVRVVPVEALPVRDAAVKQIAGGKPVAGVRVVRRAAKIGATDNSVVEVRAVSQVAPEMPLTEEERLLLRIVHRGDPVEMAMLNPLVREARDAAEKADVQRFFGVPEVHATQPVAVPTTTVPATNGDNE